MLRKNLGKLLLIILILVSGCSIVEKSKEQKPVNESKLQEIDKVSNTENATNTVSVLATSTKENGAELIQVKTEESNSPSSFAKASADKKGNWIPVKTVFLTISFGEEKKTAPVEFKEGMTVYDVLKKGTGDLKINLETQMYGMGIFIEAIGDKKNGQENSYWTYYVNDKFANVAADKYKLKAGDKVEWKFGKSPLSF